MKIKISLIGLFLLFISSYTANAGAVDSVGIKTIDGTKYIIHKLEPRETLYSLGKRYHVSVAEIQEVNPQEKDGYKIDQIGRELLIPYKEDDFKVSNELAARTKSNAKQHTVEAGQTIYSISVMYEVSQEHIIDWNDLESSTLNIGQKLWVSNPALFKSVDEQQEKSLPVQTKGEIIHVVDLGETIYSISKQYGVAQSKIIELNDLSDNNIAVGQKLVIEAKVTKEEEQQAKDQPLEIETQKPPKFHTAKKGENYRKIAAIYDIKEAKLRMWNTFKEPFVGGELIKTVAPEIAQEESKTPTSDKNKADDSRMHTVKSGETLYSLSEKYNVEVEDLRKWNSLNTYQLSKGQKLYIQNPDALMADVDIEKAGESEQENEKKRDTAFSENPQKQDTKAYFTVEEDDMPKIDKVKQKGVAEVIEGSEGTEKYLALHRTAKIGTIMQVRNDLNDQIVFVRVLGKLPNTGVDEKVVIKISKKAFEKLGGVDYKFPVEISYLPLKD